MKSHTHPTKKTRRTLNSGLWKAALIGAAVPAAITSHAQVTGGDASTFTTKVSVGLKESYDSNVYLQSEGPMANHASFVTTVNPAFMATWQPCSAFRLNFGYTPELATYFSAHSEDYVAHKAQLNLGGNIGESKWQSDNSINWVEGNAMSPTYYYSGPAPGAGVSPVPALDGMPLRDRRDGATYKDSFKFTQPIGDFFVRPVAAAVINDFMTVHEPVAHVAGSPYYYANYVDRDDLSVGGDVGYNLAKDADLYFGYRWGEQNQGRVNPADANFSNHYQRALVGMETSATDWLKFSGSVGPDFRSYFGANLPAAFHRNFTTLYGDGAATLIPGKADTISLTAKRWELPGYLGKSALSDVQYEVSWKHKCTDQLTCGLGVRAENWNFEGPTPRRNEWWYEAYGSVNYQFNEHLSAEASYNYSEAVSHINDPATVGWASKRHLVSLGAKYAF